MLRNWHKIFNCSFSWERNRAEPQPQMPDAVMGRAGSTNHTQAYCPTTGKIFTQTHQLHQATWLGWLQLDCGTTLNQAGSSSCVGFWVTVFVTSCWPREPEQEVSAVYGSVSRRKPCLSLASVTSWTDMPGTRRLMQYFNLLCHFTQMFMQHGWGRQAWCPICVHTLYLWTSLQRVCHFQHTFSSFQQTWLFRFSCHYCLHAWYGNLVPKCCRKAQVTQHDTGTAVLEIKEVTGTSFHQYGYNSTT